TDHFQSLGFIPGLSCIGCYLMSASERERQHSAVWLRIHSFKNKRTRGWFSGVRIPLHRPPSKPRFYTGAFFVSVVI
ncbi:hypothetical protein, partial [Vibrio gazogenes]|uniref:hypothetical protein n=1 Tax=Vibrio gazogenes TaxID=687 RepID=UPI0019677D6C